MSQLEDTRLILLIGGPFIIILVILLVIYWIRRDKLDLKEEELQRQKQLNIFEQPNRSIHEDPKTWNKNQIDFYQLNSWAYQLRNSNDKFHVITQIAYEMEERADRIDGLSDSERRHLLSLIENGKISKIQ